MIFKGENWSHSLQTKDLKQPQVKKTHLSAVTLLGNLVAAPDIRYRANPVVAITEVVLATNSKWLDKKNNQYKEWASYHHVKIEGALVEQTLRYAKKGDIILVHGHLANIKPNKTNGSDYHPDIVHANFVQVFDKAYTQAINQVHCSAKLISQPQLMLTEQNKQLTQAKVVINQYIYNNDKQSWQTLAVEREIHIWGKQGQYLTENAAIEDEIMVEGKLSYASNANKSQFIEVIKLHLFKN